MNKPLEEQKILSLLSRLGENEELVVKRNERGKLKWIRKKTESGEIDLQPESRGV